jgi:ribosomal protein S18 acetylase RimI-like enzyme
MEIIAADSEELIKKVVEIAGEVWRQHYPSIISKEQIEYMLEKFQSFDAVLEQMAKENYRYFLMKEGEDFDGFFAIAPKGSSLFLSKIYIKQAKRGLGLAKKSISFIKEMSIKEGFDNISLTVNRKNEPSIKAYLKLGFKIVSEMDTNIGGGYTMNDYEMRLEVK